MRYLLDSDALSDLYDPQALGHEAMTGRLASLESSEHPEGEPREAGRIWVEGSFSGTFLW